MVSTWRVVVVLAVLTGLVMSWVYPVRTYLRQRASMETTAQQVVADRAAVAELEQTNARWQDPAFIREQARERLGLVAPGETGYIVIDGTPGPAATASPNPAPTVSGPQPGRPGDVTAASPLATTGTGADALAGIGSPPWWSPTPSPTR